MWGSQRSGDDENDSILDVLYRDENDVDGPDNPDETTPMLLVAGAAHQQTQSAGSESGQSSRDDCLLAAVDDENVAEGERDARAESGLGFGGGQSPLHSAIQDTDLRRLQILLENGEDANAVDVVGDSALYTAVALGWTDGVRLLLNARADVAQRNAARNKTVLQAAVNAENAGIARLIVDAARRCDEQEYAQIVNVVNNDGMSPLFVAVNKSNVEIVEILLSAHADVTLRDNKKRNVAHMIERNGERILTAIVERHPEKMKELVGQRSSVDRCQSTPLHSAVRRGDLSTVQYLATKFPDALSSRAYIEVKPNVVADGNILHLVSASDNASVLAYFVTVLGKKPDSLRSLVDGTTDGGKTPLHFALLRRQVDFAIALIQAGADLAAEFTDENGESRSAIDVFIHQVPASVEKLTNIFDKSIQKTRSKPTVEVDYEVLWSDAGSENGFGVLKALQQTGNKLGQEVLFEHPLVESFLHLHWKRLQGRYYVLVSLNALFSFSLSLLVLFNLLFLQLEAKIAMWPMIVFGVPLIIHELECICKKQPMKCRAEFLMKCVCYGLAVCVLLPDVPVECSVFSVLLSWFELLLLISRIPNTGFYMLLFIEVAIKFLKLLSSFFFIIFGFVIAFMAIFRLTSPFDKFLPALMKTLAMMLGEFDYNNLVSVLRKESTGSQIAAMAVFVLFLVFIGLVLANLFVAVAVFNVSKVREISKRTEFLGVYGRFLLLAPCRFYPRGVMQLLFRLICAVVRLPNKRLVAKWELFQEIDRKFQIGILLTDRRLKFPRELNTAIIARGYKNREALTKKYQEEEDKRLIAERENDRKRLMKQMEELEARISRELRSEISELKQSLSAMLKSVGEI